jgi:hypothetical protein
VIGLILFGQNHLYVKMLFYKGFCYSKVFQKILLASQKISSSLSAVRTTVPSRLDAHMSTVPSVRTMCHTVRTPDKSSIICPNDVYFSPDPLLHREASVLNCIRPDVSAARPDASQYSTKLQILSIFSYGKIDATVRTMWIPVRTRFSLRQES